ncbi:MAG: hypothetical protein ACPGLV_02620 [Bacteroidia bacterium]
MKKVLEVIPLLILILGCSSCSNINYYRYDPMPHDVEAQYLEVNKNQSVAIFHNTHLGKHFCRLYEIENKKADSLVFVSYPFPINQGFYGDSIVFEETHNGKSILKVKSKEDVLGVNLRIYSRENELVLDTAVFELDDFEIEIQLDSCLVEFQSVFWYPKTTKRIKLEGVNDNNIKYFVSNVGCGFNDLSEPDTLKFEKKIFGLKLSTPFYSYKRCCFKRFPERFKNK